MTGWIAVVSTAYCLSGTMADGTGVRAGSVANNGLPLGTKVTVTAAPTQSRQFVVRDRIGWGTQLDFWVPSCALARSWGRRVVRLHVGWPKYRMHWRQHATKRLGRVPLLGPADPARDPRAGGRPFRLRAPSLSSVSWSSWPRSRWPW